MWHVGTLSIIFAFISLGSCNSLGHEEAYFDIPNNFYKDCLVEINKFRKLHGAEPLRWNTELQYHAQSWADHLANNGIVANDVEGAFRLNQGETVNYISPPKERCRNFPPSGNCYACRTTIATWYNESKYYNYSTGYSYEKYREVLHFTQLVWKGTKKVGIATAISPRFGLITVARFRPQGNVGFVDDYVENVQPPVKEGEGNTNEAGNRGKEEEEGGGQQGPVHCRPKKNKRKTEECINEYGDEICDTYIKNYEGYCNYSGAFMKIHCAKSCKFCKEHQQPAPPLLEKPNEKKENLRWKVKAWSDCHGDVQWREVQCIHRHSGEDYKVNIKYCKKNLLSHPPVYKDCP